MKDVTRMATIGALPVQATPAANRSSVLIGRRGIEAAVSRARTFDAGGFHLRLATVADLLVLKLAAAEKPRRRPSKRRQDLLDIITLAEEDPSAAAAIPQLRQRVEHLGSSLL